MYVLDYVGTLLGFILVFFGLWILLLTSPVRGIILISVGFGLGVVSFMVSKKLKRKPAAGPERL